MGQTNDNPQYRAPVVSSTHLKPAAKSSRAVGQIERSRRELVAQPLLEALLVRIALDELLEQLVGLYNADSNSHGTDDRWSVHIEASILKSWELTV